MRRGAGWLLLAAGALTEGAWRVLEPAADAAPLGRSAIVALAAATWALLAGAVSGWLLARRPPGAGALLGVAVAPLVVPPFLVALGWIDLLGPAGRITRALGGGTSGPSLLASSPLYTAWACGLMLGAALSPIVLLATRAALLRLDPSTLEAARLAQGRRGEARVALAAAAPAAVAAALLVLVLALLERATPLLVLRGVPIPVQVEDVAIRFASEGDPWLAARAALPLLGLALAAAGATLLAWRRPPPRAAHGGPRPLEGRWRVAAPAVVALLAAPGLLVPLLSLGLQVGPFPEFRSGDELRLALRLGGPDALRSTGTGLATATLALAIGLALAWPLRRQASGVRVLAAVPAVALLVVAMLPPPLLGIALLAGARPFPALDAVGDSLAIVVAACFLRFGVVSVALLLVALRAVPREQEEAARLAARAPWRVVLPQALPAAVAAGVIVHLVTITEYGASAVVEPPGASLLAVFVVNEAHYGGGSALVGLLLLLLAVAAVPVALALGVRRALLVRRGAA